MYRKKLLFSFLLDVSSGKFRRPIDNYRKSRQIIVAYVVLTYGSLCILKKEARRRGLTLWYLWHYFYFLMDD